MIDMRTIGRSIILPLAVIALITPLPGCSQSQSTPSTQRPNENEATSPRPSEPAAPFSAPTPAPVVIAPAPAQAVAPPGADRAADPGVSPPRSAVDVPSAKPPSAQAAQPAELPDEDETDNPNEIPDDEDSRLPSYVRILAPLSTATAYSAEARPREPATLDIRTQNVGRMLVTRRELPVGRNRSIALRVDGFVFEWSASHTTLILEFSPSGGWRIAESR